MTGILQIRHYKQTNQSMKQTRSTRIMQAWRVPKCFHLPLRNKRKIRIG